MGIRFSCHGCAKPLHIKTELAGRRGVCPDCRVKFRIPLTDSEFSSPLQESGASDSSSSTKRPVVNQASSGTGIAEAGFTASGQAVLQLDEREAVAGSEPVSGRKAAGQNDPGQNDPGQNDPGQNERAENERAENERAEQEIELLSGDAAATWYVRPPSGGQYGPATVDVLKTWIAEGRVAKSALLWRDGWAQWREASEALPEISETLPGGVSLAADDPFSDPKASSKLTTPLAMEKTSPVRSNLSGDASIGAIRRKRSSRRITLVAVLAALVVGLIVTLVLVAMTRA